MTTTKSSIEELELSNGMSIYLQISASGRASLSIDSSDMQITAWLSKSELVALGHLIIKINGEYDL